MERQINLRSIFPLILFLTLIVSSSNCSAFANELETSSKPATISETGDETRNEYNNTHGKLVCGIAAPYVEAYAEINKINLSRMEEKLFPSGLYLRHAPILEGVYISSRHYINGIWTHYKSNSTVFYELKKIAVQDDPSTYLLVLYNKLTPVEVADETNAEWSLALFKIMPPRIKNEYWASLDYALLSDIPFQTNIKDKYVCDMIYTGLEIENNAAKVTIEYDEIARGEGSSAVFTYWFSVTNEPVSIKLEKSDKKEDHWIRGE